MEVLPIQKRDIVGWAPPNSARPDVRRGATGCPRLVHVYICTVLFVFVFTSRTFTVVKQNKWLRHSRFKV